MTKVKFDHAVKYEGVRYPAHVAFDVKDTDVPALKASGVIILSTAAPPAPPEQENPPVQENPQDDASEEEESEYHEDENDLKGHLLSYTVPELIKFAQDHDIDLQGKTRKAEIYNVIVASLN